MAKQKKILDIDTGSAHLTCIQSFDRKDWNPYKIYLVISGPGAPLRKRLLIKYGDFLSVLSFLKDFYLDAVDILCYTDMVNWINSRRL